MNFCKRLIANNDNLDYFILSHEYSVKLNKNQTTGKKKSSPYVLPKPKQQLKIHDWVASAERELPVSVLRVSFIRNFTSNAP